MTLFTLGPVLYPDSFKLVYSVAQKEIVKYFSSVELPYDCAFIKIWIESTHKFPTKDNDVESMSDLPVFKVYNEKEKVIGYSCKSSMSIQAYLHSVGVYLRSKTVSKFSKSKSRTRDKKITEETESIGYSKFRLPSYDESSAVRAESEPSMSSPYSSVESFIMSNLEKASNDDIEFTTTTKKNKK